MGKQKVNQVLHESQRLIIESIVISSVLQTNYYFRLRIYINKPNCDSLGTYTHIYVY